MYSNMRLSVLGCGEQILRRATESDEEQMCGVGLLYTIQCECTKSERLVYFEWPRGELRAEGSVLAGLRKLACCCADLFSLPLEAAATRLVQR